MRYRPLAERFGEKWKLDTVSGCWTWTAHRNHNGYPMIAPERARNGSVRAHRVAYELFVGPIPPGLQIDHLCRNRACVNPAHLEAVTPAENLRRAPAAGFQIGNIPANKRVASERWRASTCPSCRDLVRVRWSITGWNTWLCLRCFYKWLDNAR